MGRPKAIDEATLRKLEEAFAIGATDREACFYADIAPSTLYEYQKDHPEFSERKEALKERPVLLARQTVVKALAESPKDAEWYLERKTHEFRPKQNMELEGDMTLKIERRVVDEIPEEEESEDTDETDDNAA